jgi:hypothetical protein
MNSGFVINQTFRRKRYDLSDCDDKCLWNLAYVVSCRDAYEVSLSKLLSGNVFEIPNVIDNKLCERERIRIAKQTCPDGAIEKI